MTKSSWFCSTSPKSRKPSSLPATSVAVSFHLRTQCSATLIRTYGETSFLLIETVVDVIVSHSPQQQTNKLYMEALGILLTLFSRMLRNEDIEHTISPVSPYFSSYFLLDLLFICSGMPVSASIIPSPEETPVWSSGLILSLLRRMLEPSVDALDAELYAPKESSPSLLLYPFQLFSLFSAPKKQTVIESPSATRCQLLLSLLFSVNCATDNPFVRTLKRLVYALR